MGLSIKIELKIFSMVIFTQMVPLLDYGTKYCVEKVIEVPPKKNQKALSQAYIIIYCKK